MDKSNMQIDTLNSQQRCKGMLVLLRKINQAVTLHSRDLSRRFGLTGPQLVILNDIASRQSLTVTQLARSSSLSQATVTDIVNRLEKKGLIERTRDDTDRRRVTIHLTPKCNDVLSKAPPALQESFVSRYTQLAEWEQLMILSSLQRIVDLMSASQLNAPVLPMTDEENWGNP